MAGMVSDGNKEPETRSGAAMEQPREAKPSAITEPAPDPSRVLRPLVGDEVGKDKRGLPEIELPTEQITTRKITWERARMLATTRRKRTSEFAIGGLVAALPGAAQSVVDYVGSGSKDVPSGGHLVEIAIAIVFATLTISALFQFREPTSSDVLARTFPEMVEQERLIRRLRRWVARLREDFNAKI